MEMIAGRSVQSSWPAGEGEMATRTRTHEWSKTPAGSCEAWPQSLKTAVNICLGSRHPIVVWWDREHLTQFYNDSYISFLGTKKHPSALGQSGRDCWREIWPIMAPMLEGVFTTGDATWSEDFLYVLDRNLPREEGYFTFSYSPILDDAGAVGGIFCACNETTQRVIGERRLRTLRDLSRMEVQVTAERACELAAQTLAENPLDICFSLIYLLDDKASLARLVAKTGLNPASRAAQATISLRNGGGAGWPLEKVLQTGAAEFLSGLAQTFGSLPAGPWPESSDTALIVPIPASGHATPAGMFVCGLSPRRVFDSDYQSFARLVAGHIGTSVANARAYAEERKRAEALAELDRAKTLFFSNVSHEFRTPLALMLGPLDDALSGSGLSVVERNRLEIVRRNSLRLLKLVNSLLDFSRIEAGRAQASYEPTDLAMLTIDLASNFRSACEKAGLKLVVDCPTLSEPVYVDRDMWEKIVLNLLSNAFKFTFEGEIAIRLSTVAGRAMLSVRDTGVGVPEHELPRLFERFHRIEGQASRTYEGSGIGLALVQELVKLHGGTISADGEAGRGTTFTIQFPLGTAHLPKDRISAERSLASTSIRADAYVQEALRWLPDASPSVELSDVGASEHYSLDKGSRILVADDNADMRTYVRGLLEDQLDVETVADGESALEAIRQRRPDLVLADVMMPRMDGFELLKAIRADEALRGIPVIMLSARAGEESKIEGLATGADDYLVKPFSSRELLARISAHLGLLRTRREAVRLLRESEERHAFLIKLSDALRGEVDPDAIGMLVTRMLSDHIKADRCWIARFSKEQGKCWLGPEVCKTDLPSVVGEYDSADFADCMRLIETSTLVVRNARADPRLSALDKASLAQMRVGAFVGAMLRDGERNYKWNIFVGSEHPQDWSSGEVSLLEDIAERTWAATERARAEAALREREGTLRLLLAELQHRVRNILSTVRSIANRTGRTQESVAEFQAHFDGRLSALARTQGVLTRSPGTGVDLETLIREELLAQAALDEHFWMKGPAVRLAPKAAEVVTLAIHELATNSTKYGALTQQHGRIKIEWSRVERDSERWLSLGWSESGVRLKEKPVRQGFGTELITRRIPHELQGEGSIVFGNGGMHANIAFPLRDGHSPLETGVLLQIEGRAS